MLTVAKALISGGVTAFFSAGWITQLVVVGSIIGAVLTTYGVWHHKVWESGYDRAIADIAAADAKAVARATDLRTVWRSCRDSGGVWDASTGKCSGK